MSPLKKILLAAIIGLALAEVAIGGMADILSTRIFGISPMHGWVDGSILMVLALIVSINMK